MNENPWKCGPCAMCGLDGGGHSSSTSWGHEYSCCSESCGRSFLNSRQHFIKRREAAAIHLMLAHGEARRLRDDIVAIDARVAALDAGEIDWSDGTPMALDRLRERTLGGIASDVLTPSQLDMLEAKDPKAFWSPRPETPLVGVHCGKKPTCGITCVCGCSGCTERRAINTDRPQCLGHGDAPVPMVWMCKECRTAEREEAARAVNEAIEVTHDLSVRTRGECVVCGHVPTLPIQLCEEHMMKANNGERLARLLRRCVGYPNGPISADTVSLYARGHARTDRDGAEAQALIDAAIAMLEEIGEP